jgi:DNA-binding response OmpR family regulator
MDIARPAPATALIVEPDTSDRNRAVSALTAVGFTVTALESFIEARAYFSQHPPIVLVTDVRLAAYNGLQLVLRGRLTSPYTAMVVTSAFDDPVLRREAEQAGATFALKPFTASELCAAVFRTALRQAHPDGTVTPIRAPFERRQHQRRQSERAWAGVDQRKAERREDVMTLLTRVLSMQ